MKKTSRFKFLLSILILVNITLPLFSMEEDSHKRKRDEEPEEVFRNIRSRIELSDLSLEVRLHIINQGILSIIENNGIFHPLEGVKEFIFSVSMINKEYNSFKNEFLKNARMLAKQVFASEFSNNSQEEQINLDNQLQTILQGEYNQENEIKAAKLIIAGANPNVMIGIKTSTRIYQVPIIMAISFIGKFKNLIDLLATYKANLNYQLENGNTALINSIILGYDDISKMLIDNGVDVDIKNKEGNTALMFAIIRNKLDIVKELISHGADVNARGVENNTALMLAITFERIPIIDILIDHGAEINVSNDEGLTPREIANKLKLDSIVKLIDSKVEK